MQLRYHVVISVGLGAILYALFRSLGLTVIFTLSGIFIDLDHFIDYWYQTGFSLKIKEFFEYCYGRKFERSFLVLHCWEWVALLAAAAWLHNWNLWIAGLAAGFTVHLVTDQLTNGPVLLGYSLFYRWRKKFLFLSIFPD